MITRNTYIHIYAGYTGFWHNEIAEGNSNSKECGRGGRRLLTCHRQKDTLARNPHSEVLR